MAQRPNSPQQQGLFGPVDSSPGNAPVVSPCLVDAEVRALATELPDLIHLGTSSWAFAGWRGIVYAPRAAQKHLARHGLAAYGKHPLLRSVGIDRTFYGPIAVDDFAGYAAAVPADFRFLVKAWGELTTPFLRNGGGTNPHYLDAELARREVVEPALRGLGERLGPVVLQFPPQGSRVTRQPDAFIDDLYRFLIRLPEGVRYAVELRDELLCTERYGKALAAAGAGHCFSVHPRMPSIERQRELVAVEGPVTVRWMLQQGLGYEEARARYAPFDRLVDPDPGSRAQIARLCLDAIADNVPVVVIANNKAEGSAPLSLLELARELVGR